MTALLDSEAAVELTREVLQWSMQLYPERSVDDHLDRTAAAVSSLTGCPDPWLNAALERAAAQAGVEVP
jgi:hypothetical protein